MPGVRLYGPGADEPSVPICAITSDRMDPGRIASALDRRAHIAVRSGLHCAPWAHRTIGTLETGAVRFGVGWGDTDEDIDVTLQTLKEILA